MIKLYKYLTLVLALLAVIILFVSCERENLYDFASFDGRTAYALVENGTTYRLIIANIHFDKTYTSSFIFTTPIFYISSNHQQIIVCDTDKIYKSGSNLTEWFEFAPKPPSAISPILEYHDTFIVIDNTSPSILDTNTHTWNQPYGSLQSDLLFRGFDDNVYGFYDTSKVFYSLGSTANYVTQFNSFAPTGTLIGGYRTKNYFYVWYTGGQNSIARTNGFVDTTFNPSTSWNSVADAAVNDNDELFAVIFEIINNLQLIKMNDVDNYSTLLELGNGGIFKMDFLDNDHLIIASKQNTNGYNGLFIYNIKDNTI
ncbi:MAG: hypothetical protein ACUVRK_11215 [Spirochaetota bacterium]